MRSHTINMNIPNQTHDGYAWAQSAEKEGSWGTAANRWAVLRAAYPDEFEIWFREIAALIQNHQLTPAKGLLADAEKKFPENPNWLISKAHLQEHQNLLTDASKSLQLARGLHPETLEVWLESCELNIRMGNFPEAEAINLEAQKHFPDNKIIITQFAEIATKAEDWKTAIERWQKYSKLYPLEEKGFIKTAEAARKLGNYKLAKQIIYHSKSQNELKEAICHESLGIKTKSTPHRHSTFFGLTELIWTKALFNLRAETQLSYLSYLWWILEPLMHMVVYFLLFGILLQRGGEGFIAFLLTGLIPWMWFGKAVNSSANSILTGKGLLLQVGLPSIFFPLVTILQATIKQIPVFSLLLGFVWLQGHPPGAQWLALPAVILLQALLIIATGCIFAAIVPFAKDLTHVIPTGMTFIMFLSGVFYSHETIPPQWRDIFLLNPIAFLLKSYRDILILETWPDMTSIGMWFVISLILCSLVLQSYKKLRYIFPRVVIS